MRITTSKIKNQNIGAEIIILMSPGVLGFILLFFNPIFGAVFFIIGLLSSMLLPNIYATDKLIFSKEGLEIQGKNLIKWKSINQIKIHYTEGLISNYVKVIIYIHNSNNTTFFLCKKSITEWELASMRDFIQKIPEEVKLSSVSKLRVQ